VTGLIALIVGAVGNPSGLNDPGDAGVVIIGRVIIGWTIIGRAIIGWTIIGRAPPRPRWA
jgi:hypothetical protein